MTLFAGAVSKRYSGKHFSRDLRLIGGIDLDALRGSRADIQKELQTKIPFLWIRGALSPWRTVVFGRTCLMRIIVTIEKR